MLRRTTLKAVLTTILLVSAVVGLNACSRSTPVDERPIPAELAQPERQTYRKLPMDGAHNFRDLGGYQTKDGRRLQWGRLYRSDKLSDLTPADEQYLEKLGLRQIVDFRSVAEREEAPNRIAPDSSIAIVNRPITVEAAAVDMIKDKIGASDTTPEEMGAFLVAANRQMVEEFTPVYREWMHSLLDERNYPMVFHCTAGKDRTGLAAALVLYALDVPMDTIMDDYLATNHYTQDYIDKMVTIVEASTLFRANTEAVRALFAVDKAYLGEAFAAMDEHYGGIDNYLEAGLGIGAPERARLRELLLQP